MSDARSCTDKMAIAVGRHHPMGVSTGVFGEHRGRWRDLVHDACEVSTYVVELSALSEDEFPSLAAFLASGPRLPFRYVSVHAPAKDRALDDEQSARQLSELPLWVRSIITHPDALHDLTPYRSLGTRLVLENMDDRKAGGRTTDELAVIFEELPDAGFCLDVAHAFSIDPTMQLGHALLDRFRSRLRQVHLSSLHAGRHVPLTEEDEQLFGAVLARCHDVPWILEARPPERWSRRVRAARPRAVGGQAPVPSGM